MSVSENEALLSPKGRNRTDKSLSAERAKTDESLSEGRNRTERQADQAVLLSRAEADGIKSLARLDADNLQQVDGRLRLERQEADEALETERRHSDSVLEHERSEMRAVQNEFFQTERKETDRNLTDERHQVDIEVQVTRAALTTRDEFLAIVSHDLKNPLGSISMAAELLKDKPFYATADEETREYLDVIGRNAGEALRLIRDLLDMERVAVGKLGLHIEECDVDDIVHDATAMLEPLATSRKISLKCDASEARNVAACDRDRVSQVLSNLIGNAIKFTPAGGSITVAVRCSDVEVQISVTDTGPGIPEDMRKIVFERFWQIGRRDRQGLGLGLYISTMIVEAHGGRIWVDSKVGQGSIFHFTLPVGPDSALR